MPIKRMRVFAGPNGSGKTTIVKSLQAEIPFGVYVNADDIERIVRETKVLFFDNFQLNITENELQDFFKSSRFSPVKRGEAALWTHLMVVENVLHVNTAVDSYLAADIAEFIRQQLLANGLSFTYETVMSHEGKIEFLQQARDSGYKVYLYFIATEDASINVSRVNVRVSQNGHYVPPEVITKRYFKSLQQLKQAVKKTNRAYIWDNSGTASLLIAEVTDGVDVRIIDTERVPNWFVKYLVD
ncbi:MAG: zeta toxin family protein [Chitinophagaceae bacterium]